jgi:dipeptidyl aminopeptidase/acylaminoacyl peptidase
LQPIFSNPVSSKLGLVKLVLTGLLHAVVWLCSAAVQIMTLSLINIPVTSLAPAPAAPLQYFVDRQGQLTGCAECSISFGGIAMRFTRRLACGRWEAMGAEILLADLNMQLVGSGAATGTLRMDRLASFDGGRDVGAVAIHTCNVSDTTAYVEYPSGRVLANHAAADISSFITNPLTGMVEAVVVVTDRSELIPLGKSGERYKQALKQISAILKRTGATDTIATCSRSARDDIWVLSVSSDAKPAVYYLVHSPYAAAVTPSRLLAARPVLAGYVLGEAAAVLIPARDGVLLPGYLTLPPPSSSSSSSSSSLSVGPQQQLPLVLVLHGGPSARDYPGYNPVVQLLAARGIAVLTVDYRGSAGYGMQFLRRGNGAMREMHNDVEDARCWAVERGVADPTRVAIMGASWGGYLALGGATGLAAPLPTPELDAPVPSPVPAPVPVPTHHRYAAVVAIVPPVTVGKANTSTSFRGDPLVARYWRQIYGADVSDHLSAAEALSPLFHLGGLVGTRLLLVHGEDDPRVPREHGDGVAAAARELGVPGAYVTYAREGHSIRREPNVLHMWGLVERFLCSALGVSAHIHREEEGEEGGAGSHTATVHWNSSPGLV